MGATVYRCVHFFIIIHHFIFCVQRFLDIFCRIMYNLHHGHTLNGRRLFPPFAITYLLVPFTGRRNKKAREVIVMDLIYLILAVLILVALDNVIKNIKK